MTRWGEARWNAGMAGIRSRWRSRPRWLTGLRSIFHGSGQPLAIVLLMVVGAGILLRLVNLGQAPLSGSEAIALIQAAGEAGDYIPPGSQAAPLSRYQALFDLPRVDDWRSALSAVGKVLGDLRGEGVPPLTALGQTFCLQWFGTSVGAHRLWGAVGGIATIAAGYGLGRSLLGSRRGGGILAALLAVHPLLLGRSLVANGDGWVMLAITLGIWGVVGRWPWLWLSLVLGWGLASDYRFAIAMVALVILGIPCRALGRLGAAGLGAIALIAPWWLWAIEGGPRANGHPAPLLAELPSVLGRPWFPLPPEMLAHVGPGLSLSQRIEAIAQTLAGLGLGATEQTGEPVIAIAVIVLVGLGALLLGGRRGGAWGQGSGRRWPGLRPTAGTVGAIAGGVPLVAAGLGAAFQGTPDWTLGAIALPGLLCPVAAGLCAGTRRGWEAGVVGLLAVYLAIDAGLSPPSPGNLDPVVATLERVSPRPTLILLDSRDRGTILRLAYYIPPLNLVHLLAWDPHQQPPDLDPVLTDPRIEYVRLLWIDHGLSDNRAAIAPGATDERSILQAEIDQYFQLVATEVITDGSPPQHYTLRVYARSPAI